MQTSQTSTSTNSPLEEVQKNSLAELFAKDPLKLTKDDVTAIAKELRGQRHQWLVEEKAKLSKPPRGAAKAKAAPLSKDQMDSLLDSLDIKL